MKTTASLTVLTLLFSQALFAKDSSNNSGLSITEQREKLQKNTNGKGFGPQSPRDIDEIKGKNSIVFNQAPNYKKMNLCNIHFHKNAEHKGGEFTSYAGDGNLMGKDTGFKYDGVLTDKEKRPLDAEVCPGKYGGLNSGDTIELHYVHSSAEIKPGPTLGACLNESIMNPQLRVEAQVFVLVNDEDALDFHKLTKHKKKKGKYRAVNIPDNTGKPVQYLGSTTGPSYNMEGSPLQVSWSVRPDVAKVNIHSVKTWCEDNIYNEDHAHGVRNLVVNPKLLSDD